LDDSDEEASLNLIRSVKKIKGNGLESMSDQPLSIEFSGLESQTESLEGKWRPSFSQEGSFTKTVLETFRYRALKNLSLQIA
jgi:hypothetical protein